MFTKKLEMYFKNIQNSILFLAKVDEYDKSTLPHTTSPAPTQFGNIWNNSLQNTEDQEKRVIPNRCEMWLP